MKIVYVAKHGSGGNDDEGAIAYALRQLGHEVQCFAESVSRWTLPTGRFDLLLFHKWDNVDLLERFQGHKVFWYFDLVDYPQDPSLEARCRARKQWMERIIPHVDLGFCTDGDWVERINKTLLGEPMTDPGEAVIDGPMPMRNRLGKLVWLPQGADERVVGRGDPSRSKIGPSDILFTGLRRAGKGREDWWNWMQRTFGDRFKWVERGMHGRDLADAIAAAKVVVAPDAPVTDRYWSNRVYLTLGFGGFLLHPHCRVLFERKDSPLELTYANRQMLHDQMLYYLDRPDERQMIAGEGMEQVGRQHLYRHRCERLVRTVKERLG